MPGLSEISSAGNEASCLWWPEVLPVAHPQTAARLEVLHQSGRVFQVRDTLEQQLCDLVRCLYPKMELSDKQAENRIPEITGGIPVSDFGVWVFYPWSGCLIRTLPEPLFQETRTNRNRHKISIAEQKHLASSVIGIVGLSAGMAIATTLALEGVGHVFRLADFDSLSLSNLNRLCAPVSELGTNKAVIAARRLFELNPFLKIELFSAGVTDENIDAFFGKHTKLSVLIEECDQLWMKVRLREEAKRQRIPVVMDTSDSGMLDVERFDLEPNRDLFHGLIGSVTSEEIRRMSKEDRLEFVLRIVEPERMSSTAAASLLEIGETLSTWPQLASSVIAGGAVVTGVVRRILLGTFSSSGRYFVDPDTIIAEGHGNLYRVPNPAPDDWPVPVPLPHPPRGLADSLSRDELIWLISHAVMAPSGGNIQPWGFEAEANEIFGYLDPDRRSPLLDFDYSASLLALGAAAENLMIGATELGFRGELQEQCFDSWDQPVFRVQLRRDSDNITADPLFPEIVRRSTNRRLGKRVQLTQHQETELRDEASRSGTTLQLLTSDTELDAIANLIGQTDQLRFLSRAMHAEVVSELRWTMQDARQKRDGIDPASLELGPSGQAILRLLKSWPVMERLRATGLGQGLGANSIKLVKSSAAVGLLTMPQTGRHIFFRGGRAVQRVWLRAGTLGIWIQPMSVLPFLFARCLRGGGDGLSCKESEILAEMRERYCQLFTISAESTELLLFRIIAGPSPTSRSLRRDVNSFLRARETH